MKMWTFTAISLLLVFSGALWAQYQIGDSWLVDQGAGQIIRVMANNQIDPQVISGFKQPVVAAINPTDWSLWVADSAAQIIVKFGADKSQAAMIKGVKTPSTIAVDPSDGSIWVGTENSVVKYSADGKRLFRMGGVVEAYVAVNPNDGTCWVTDAGKSGNPPGRVIKLASDGTQLRVVDKGFTEPKGVAVYPKDGSAWIVDSQGNQVVKLDANGNVAAKVEGLNFPSSVSVNPKDGTAWIADTQNGRLVKVDPNGKIIQEVPQNVCMSVGIMFPTFVAVDPNDGGIWVIDQIMRQVLKFDASGKAKIQIPRQILKRPSFVTISYLEKK
jgi:DNA-binding beta-propeller fold protein YncE